MTREEIFAKKENRLVLLEGQSTRVSVTNLMRNIAILTPIQVPFKDLQNAVPEYEQNFENLLHALNENKSEHLFDDSILEYLPEMDTNLGDYLMSVSNLIEQYQPFKESFKNDNECFLALSNNRIDIDASYFKSFNLGNLYPKAIIRLSNCTNFSKFN